MLDWQEFLENSRGCWQAAEKDRNGRFSYSSKSKTFQKPYEETQGVSSIHNECDRVRGALSSINPYFSYRNELTG
jgi:hypothetical protein